MRSVLSASVAAMLAVVLYLVGWPCVVRVSDLVFQPTGLHEPVLTEAFDFWEEGNERQFPLNCSRGSRFYELAILAPASDTSSGSIDRTLWPDLGGRFRVVLVRNGREIRSKQFDGRFERISAGARNDRATDIFSLTTFFVRRCSGTSIRLTVLEPATNYEELRSSVRIVLRVSTEI